MRMRPDVGQTCSFRRQLHRARVVQEDEWPDHPPFRERQYAPDCQTGAQLGLAGVDDRIEHRSILKGLGRLARAMTAPVTRS
jgi:hypothetical protein